MRRLILLACLLAAPAAADPAGDILTAAEATCAGFENGVFDPGDAVTAIDLTGDGADDLLIDEAGFTCSSGASMYCGSGGCMLHAIVGDSVTSLQATGWRTLDWGPARILLVGRDGGWCGGVGAEVCFEALNWSEGRFLTIAPPGD